MHPARASSFIKLPAGDRTYAVPSGTCSQREEVISLLVPNWSEVEFMVIARHPKVISNDFKIIRFTIAIQISNPGELGTLGHDKFRVGKSDHTKGVMQTLRE